ncbi:MAG: acyltransferase [Proteobacteria bacterium]|jgi:galactoside O-acetyltransferase|nr:acyltransferase [Pseudomonadota bacterium]
MNDDLKKTHKAITGKGSALTKYQDVIIGNRSLLFLFYYEWCAWIGVVPGALGMLLRQIFWPRLFGSCGRKAAFAKGIVLRHPRRIHLGDSVVISEGCILDGRHDDTGRAIVLGDNVILSNNVILSCKNGSIAIGDSTGINAGTIIQSTNHCPVTIGADVIIGQMSFVIGGGNYNIDRLDVPIRLQGIKNDGGVMIDNNVWIGAHVTVLGGVTVGTGCVVAASAVLTRSIPPNSIAKGIPAVVTGTRCEGVEQCA